jgi:N-ethylmaleimide reductase
MKLLEKYKLGDINLKNRLVMAPMTRCRATDDGIVTPITVEYYVQRASAGLIITEATNISEQAIGSPNTPGIYTTEQVEAWKKVTEAVHEKGSTIIQQLWHTGRVGHSSIKNGKQTVAPSAIRIEGQQVYTSAGLQDYEVPRALETAEVKMVIEDYREAAKNALTAGFDGVELHAGFGYLPNQFLVDSSNNRTDEYGGNIENRSRFVLEILNALLDVWGPGKVGIKLSPSIPFNGMIDSDPTVNFGYLISILDKLPLAYLHLMQPVFPIDAFPHWPKDVLHTFRPLFNGDIIVNGGYNREKAENVVQSKEAQLVAFGTSFLANPDLPERFATGAKLNEPDSSTFYNGGEKGYIDYPAMN